MSLYNRITRQNQPVDWQDNHQYEFIEVIETPNPDSANTVPISIETINQSNAGKNANWFRWHINGKTLCDVMLLIHTGIIQVEGTDTMFDKIKEIFDMSNAEVEQVKEIYNRFVRGKSDIEVMYGIQFLEKVFGAIERGVPQELDRFTTEEDFNTFFGITTPDDR